MKYLVLAYHAGASFGGWEVYYYGTNYRDMVTQFNKCKKEHRECKLIRVGETLKEQRL